MSPNIGSQQPATVASAIADLSRVTFFDGQRLAADDLNGAATVQRELRWLHNRALHSWGIGLGFSVSGPRGSRQVRIGPGYALDCLGREIILTETVEKPVPARAGDSAGGPMIYYLVTAYPDDSLLTVLERRRGECGTDGAVRLQERAAIYWKADGEQTIEQGLEVVLAQATVQNCQLAAPLSILQRRSARPPQQPFIAAGATVSGQTIWEPWTFVDDGEERVIGLTTRVDTSSARFGGTPEYQAQLRGERFFNNDLVPDVGLYVLDGSTFVSLSSPTGFTFSVAMPRSLFGSGSLPFNPNPLLDQPDALVKLVGESWFVVWIGVEG